MTFYSWVIKMTCKSRVTRWPISQMLQDYILFMGYKDDLLVNGYKTIFAIKVPR